MNFQKNLGAIILAAGKGKRMQSSSENKVTLQLAKKPLILYSVHLLKQLEIDPVLIVVGFAKESVEKALQGEDVVFVHQKEQLGTAHAVSKALKKLPEDITEILVIQGDDSAFYKKETIGSLAQKHIDSNASITLLTIELEDPSGLGRVIRNDAGDVVSIIEEKDASEEVRTIKEINPACYMFHVAFLKKYLSKVEKSSITGEYYLTSLIDIAIKHNEKLETVKGGNIPWRGVNTPDEFSQAEKLYSVLK